MKGKCFFKIIAIAVNLTIILAFVFVPAIKAQTYITVAADHNLEVQSEYECFSMRYLATAYFEIKFDIKAVKGPGTKDVEIILSADNELGDVDTVDDNTFIYYIGDNAYSSSMAFYDTIGTSSGYDIEIPAFTALFTLAALEDSDWGDYTWAGSEIEKITVTLVAGSSSTTHVLKIKEYRFEDNTGDDHDDSQDFADYASLSDAYWETLGGEPVINTSDKILYLRSSYLAEYEQNYFGDKDKDGFEFSYDCDPIDPNTYPGAQEVCDGKDNDCNGLIPAYELDKDKDGFMVCRGDCDDNNSTIYPGAYGNNRGIDNNCNGVIDDNEMKRLPYSIDTHLFPLWMQSRQLGIIPFLPPYPDYPKIQKQMWYPFQSTFSQHKFENTRSYFFHPALFTWLLNLNFYPFYSPFMSFDMNFQHDISSGQYLDSIIFSPFIFESNLDNEKTYKITLLSIIIYPDKITLECGETSQLTVTGYYSDGSIVDLTKDAGTIYVSTNQDVVKVQNDGKVITVGYGYGNSTIIVKNSGKTDKIDITIKEETYEIDDIKGDWAGTWEASLTDPNEGVVTDPNGQIVISMSGDIRFYISEQPSTEGVIMGTIEITGWDVDPQPQDWPGDWTGESDEVMLTGWIDQVTRYLKACYYYYPGKEAFGDYDENEDPRNIKGFYTWMFNANKLKITKKNISGQFSITGPDKYYEIGRFSVERSDTQ